MTDELTCPDCSNEDIWDVDCEKCEAVTAIIVKGDWVTCPDCFGEGTKQDWFECSECHHVWEAVE